MLKAPSPKKTDECFNHYLLKAWYFSRLCQNDKPSSKVQNTPLTFCESSIYLHLLL